MNVFYNILPYDRAPLAIKNHTTTFYNLARVFMDNQAVRLRR